MIRGATQNWEKGVARRMNEVSRHAVSPHGDSMKVEKVGWQCVGVGVWSHEGHGVWGSRGYVCQAGKVGVQQKVAVCAGWQAVVGAASRVPRVRVLWGKVWRVGVRQAVRGKGGEEAPRAVRAGARSAAVRSAMGQRSTSIEPGVVIRFMCIHL